MNEAVCNQKMHYKEFSLDGCDEVKSFGQQRDKLRLLHGELTLQTNMSEQVSTSPKSLFSAYLSEPMPYSKNLIRSK